MANSTVQATGPWDLAGSDLRLPFQVERGRFRGRFVRMGPVLQVVLGRHGYPDVVSALVAETMVLAAVLAGALKFDGVFTLQLQGNGPIGLVIADITSAGALRGCASFDREALAALPATDRALPVRAVGPLLGTGYLAFTIDRGADTDRFQGIVPLEGNSVTDCVVDYFRRSEQLQTAVKVAVEPPGPDDGSGWQAGAVMIQRMPGDSPLSHAEDDEAWEESVALLGSLTDGELLDATLPPAEALYRLFHSQGIRVFDTQALAESCRCSRERIETLIRAFTWGEIREMLQDGIVTVTCEFCSTAFRFDEAEIARLKDRSIGT